MVINFKKAAFMVLGGLTISVLAYNFITTKIYDSDDLIVYKNRITDSYTVKTPGLKMVFDKDYKQEMSEIINTLRSGDSMTITLEPANSPSDKDNNDNSENELSDKLDRSQKVQSVPEEQPEEKLSSPNKDNIEHMPIFDGSKKRISI